MPWKESTAVSERFEFIKAVDQSESNFSELCRRYGISRTTGYKWLKRHSESGLEGLQEKSRRPHHSPNRTSPEIEAAILKIRQRYPS